MCLKRSSTIRRCMFGEAFHSRHFRMVATVFWNKASRLDDCRAAHRPLFCAMQVLHALLEDIHLDFRYSSAAQSSKFAIRSIQIDDQLLTSAHPVVLAPTQSSNASIPTVRRSACLQS